MNCEFCDEEAIYVHLIADGGKPEHYCWKHGQDCPGCRLIKELGND